MLGKRKRKLCPDCYISQPGVHFKRIPSPTAALSVSGFFDKCTTRLMRRWRWLHHAWLPGATGWSVLLIAVYRVCDINAAQFARQTT